MTLSIKKIILYLCLSLTLVGCQQIKSLTPASMDENTIDLNKLQTHDLITLAGESKKFKTITNELTALPSDYQLTEVVANEKYIYGIMTKGDGADQKFYLLQVNRKTGRQRFLIFYRENESIKSASQLQMTSLGPVFNAITKDTSTIHLLNEHRGKFERLYQLESTADLLISSDENFIGYVNTEKPNEAWLYDLEEREEKILTDQFNLKLGRPYLWGEYIIYATDEDFHLHNRVSGEEFSLKIQPFDAMRMPQGNEAYLLGILGNQDATSILVYPLKTAQPELYRSKELLNITGSLSNLTNILIQTERGIYIVDPMNYTLQKLYEFQEGEEVSIGKKNHTGNYQILIKDAESKLKFVEFSESVAEN